MQYNFDLVDNILLLNFTYFFNYIGLLGNQNWKMAADL